MKKLSIALSLALVLSACNYDNTFNGTFNGAPASLKALSKNINRYCVALTITAGSEVRNSYISAQSVFDASDVLKPMSFNTKGAECGANLDEYLVGNRNTTVMNISYINVREPVGVDYCRYTTYKNYQYKEEISFEMKKNATDESTGTFSGVGQVSELVDYDHPVSSGPIFYCGQPHPIPGPNYPYPHPMPHPGPHPHYGGGFGIHYGPRP